MDYEEEEHNKKIRVEESTYVGKKVVGREAELNEDLRVLRIRLKKETDEITKIDTDIKALDADYESFLRIILSLNTLIIFLVHLSLVIIIN